MYISFKGSLQAGTSIKLIVNIVTFRIRFQNKYLSTIVHEVVTFPGWDLSHIKLFCNWFIYNYTIFGLIKFKAIFSQNKIVIQSRKDMSFSHIKPALLA